MNVHLRLSLQTLFLYEYYEGKINIKNYQFKAEGGKTSHEYLQVSEGAGRDGLGFAYAGAGVSPSILYSSELKQG